jgi:uncharacterized membrane protein
MSRTQVDITLVRKAVEGVVEADRFADWLLEVPDRALIALMAPLEMLTFQFHLTPPRDRHLIRAARVVCDAATGALDGCPDDLVHALGALRDAVLPTGR